MDKKLISLEFQKRILFIPFVNGIVVICAVINYQKLKRYIPLFTTIAVFIALSVCFGIFSLVLLKHYPFWQANLIIFGIIVIVVYLFAVVSFFYQRRF